MFSHTRIGDPHNRVHGTPRSPGETCSECETTARVGVFSASGAFRPLCDRCVKPYRRGGFPVYRLPR